MLASLLMAALGLAARVLAQEAACYAPNGDLANNETYVPCNKLGINQSGVFSSCCALDGPPDQRDTCSSSGLCINRQGQPQRGYCTDRTWKSKACNHVCTDVQTGGNPGNISFMTACNDGTAKYCCGRSNTTCCGTDAAFSIATQEAVCTANSTSSDGTTAEASSPFKGATIGLAVVAGVSLLAGLLSTTWLWKQNKKLKTELAEKTESLSRPMEPQFTGATSSYAGTSPQQTYKSHYGTSSPPPPMSPNSDYRHGNLNRYSELDASAAVARSEMGSPSPYDQPGRDSPVPGHGNGHGAGSYGSPMHSPHLPQS
ncbi:hypothetical protein CH63R_01916 [Colletotrichum higginsianum IMI 349063]|uniref:Uncharacterized protein n=3 Tax=Colletotrichum higginsianum TaxID=80884 RepID=A0A1B7YMB7_COLHI|nr:hypothetical protein CH63R_01916 [Colletotrichum higginsianum IMI 349063]OBR13190.1 hypothetical protein CH63R_01916 [Colletotrichum higginsianum IMI 349063]TID01625.1 hypothetical protein CH35J_003443 [Colletotrichum higginsianum]